MAKVVIVYASMSGNTEEIAKLLKESMEGFQHEITMQEIEHMNVNELLDYDGILIGSYTWGDGDLPYETEEFYEDLSSLQLAGKKAAVFGSGDHAYPKFCEAVILFEERLKESNADIILDGLKIELAPETQEDIEKCVEFAVNFASQVGE